jgi:hypothetical protein
MTCTYPPVLADGCARERNGHRRAWIQRRWRVDFDDSRRVSTPEYRRASGGASALRARLSCAGRRRPGGAALQSAGSQRVMPVEDRSGYGERPGTEFRRDRLTWIAYLLNGWFGYLQAAPGLVIVHRAMSSI